jgi:hypothetical protein
MDKESAPRFGTVNFERRKHPRLSVDLPLEYWQIDNPKSHSGHTADISEGGLLFHISEEIEIGQNLRVRIFLDSGLKLTPIESQVQVVWKDFQGGKEGPYCIGSPGNGVMPPFLSVCEVPSYLSLTVPL